MQHDMYDEDSGPFLLKRGKPPRLKTLKAQMSSHFKIKGDGKIISELEKNEKIDKNLLRYLTVRVKKFDLDTDYFKRNDEIEEVNKKYIYEKKK